ncbi:MAG: nucleotidyl transferase AbiEii/AbiGii toxin family protein [Bdellovibrionales bacterium]|nr:nucleotidyl transferase AbiEii/AbiGii toxin family protein [Bdellovibrionales bacterium]
MTPLRLLAEVVSELERRHAGCFAVAGGLAASWYRLQPRLTNDVDIVLDVGGVIASRDAAEALIEHFGYRPAAGWISDPEGRLETVAALVIGSPPDSRLGEAGGAVSPGATTSGGATIDFLLPAFPWAAPAVERAQQNRIDFGFGRLPTMTPEDVIVAKTFALAIDRSRFRDLDDLQAIFRAENELDLVYLVEQFERLSLALPEALHEEAPAALRRVSRKKQHAR